MDKRGVDSLTMTVIWTGMVVISILCGLATGRGPEVAAAAVEGTSAAVQLALSIAGMLCLWTGVMEVMRRSGLADKLSQMLGPVLRRLFPQAARDAETMDSISANVSANLLGLGSEGRMNVPSTLGGNWRWRTLPGSFTPELADRLRQEMKVYQRLPG